MTRPTIAFLWDTPLKAGERHIRRQVLGTRAFEPVVLVAAKTAGIEAFPAAVVSLGDYRHRGRRLWRKYVLRAPRSVYRSEPEGLLAEVQRRGVRLVHVFFGHQAIQRLVGLRLLDVPFTVSFHGVDVSWCSRAPAFARHLPELFERAAGVMARSDHMGRRLIELGCPATKIWINRAGIPLEEFPFARRERPPSHPPTILQVGRLIPKKGLPDTLAAFAEVRRRVAGARLWIAGEGELRGRLEREIEGRGLGEAVRLLGFLEAEALVRAMHDADLFVHPSVTTEAGDHEGIPNSLLEAMATGLAPVATRHAGIPEAVRHGESGWLVPERSPGALAERLLWCAAHPDAVREAGLAARRFVEQHHALDLRMRLLDDKYAELIRDHGPPPQGPRRSVADRLREIDLPRYRT